MFQKVEIINDFNFNLDLYTETRSEVFILQDNPIFCKILPGAQSFLELQPYILHRRKLQATHAWAAVNYCGFLLSKALRSQRRQQPIPEKREQRAPSGHHFKAETGTIFMQFIYLMIRKPLNFNAAGSRDGGIGLVRLIFHEH